MSKRFVNFKNKMGKAALTIALVGATTVGAHAATMEAVTTANLNMRTGEGTNHQIVTTIKKGEKVQVLEDEGSWWKVKYNNKEGYSYKNYLRISNNKPAQKEGKVNVGSSRLNVRSGAGTNYKVLGKLSTGATVKITGEKGSWYEINYKGDVGFVHKDYVKNVNNSGSTSVNKVMKVNTGKSTLNVRTGAGTGYRRMGSLANGTTVNVLEKTSNGWYKIEFKGGIGFVSGGYLVNVSNGSQDTSKVEVIGSAKVDANGSRLMLRAGQGTHTNILAKLSDGVTIEIVKDSNPVKGWTKVKVGNVVGYVSSQYLSNVQTKPEQKPEEKPETPQPPVEKPEVPEVPETPEKPETPEPPVEKPEEKPEVPSVPGEVINHAPIIEHDATYITDNQIGFDEKELLKVITATDKEDGDLSSKIVLEHNIKGDVGEYTVKISETDSKGAVATSTIKVIIQEAVCAPNQAPVITAKENLVLTVGDTFSNDLLEIKATDAEEGDLTSKVKVEGTVDTTLAGTYELVITVEDNKGAETTKRVTVKVNPAQGALNFAPTIEATQELTIEEDSKFDISLLNIVAKDKEDGVITDQVVVEGTVDTAQPGEYTLVLKVTDSKGATATKVVKVIVEMKDTTPEPPKPPVTVPGETINAMPVITANNEVKIKLGDTFSNDMLNISATDKEDGTLTSSVAVNGTVNTNKVGVYTLTLTVTDSKGATATKTVNVIVEGLDMGVINKVPVITAQDVAIDIKGSFNNSMLKASATDAEDGKITNLTYSGTVNTNKVGTYAITITATDSKGAVGTKTVNVKVRATRPSISGKHISIYQGDKFSYDMLEAKAFDCEGKPLEITYEGTVNTNRLGFHYVTINTVDEWGQIANTPIQINVVERPQVEQNPNSAEFKAMVANEMYALVNAHRAANGLPAYTSIGRLEGMANAWSKHMADTGVFDHVINGSNASATFPQFGSSHGENIAMTSMAFDGALNQAEASKLANKLFSLWKNSSGHNMAMLDEYYEGIGFGFHAVKNGNSWTIYATQEFYEGTKSIKEAPQELGKEEVKEDQIEADAPKQEEETPKVEEPKQEEVVTPEEPKEEVVTPEVVPPVVEEQPEVEAPKVEIEDVQEPTVEIEDTTTVEIN